MSTLPRYFASIRKGVSGILRGSSPDWRVSITHVTFARDINVMALLEWALMTMDNVKSDGWLSNGMDWLYLSLNAFNREARVSCCVEVSIVNCPTFIVLAEGVTLVPRASELNLKPVN